MEDEDSCEEQLRLLRTPFGLEQRAAYVHLDRIHEELDDYLLLPSAFAPVLLAAGGRSSHGLAAGATGTTEAGEMAKTQAATTAAAAAGVEADTAVSTVLIVGDQNAGKTSFLFCFSRSLFLQQLQLSSFLPLLRASFVNARLMFITSQQLLRMQRAAAATPQQTAAAAVVRESDAAKGSTAAARASGPAAAPGTVGGAAVAAALGERATEEDAAGATRVVAAEAATERRPALNTTATSAAGSGDTKAGAAEGEDTAAGGTGSSRRGKGVESNRTSTEDSSEAGARWTSKTEKDALLSLARDELPFLDSDIARALVLFTVEDFLFFCDEFGVPTSCCGRGSNRSSSLESCSSSQGSKEDDAATCPAFLQAAGVRYVAVHLLEFGGDHLDRLLRFFQLTSRGPRDCWRERSSKSNMPGSAASSLTSALVSDSSSSRESGRTSHSCTTSSIRPTTRSYRKSAKTFDSCPGSTGASVDPSLACCAEGLSHWRIAMGTGSVEERAIAVEAAEHILAEEQRRFEEALRAKTEQEELTSGRAAAEPGAGVTAVRAAAAPVTPRRIASPGLSSAHPVSPARAFSPAPADHAAGASVAFPAASAAPAAAVAAPASACAGETGGDRGHRARGSSTEDSAAAAGTQDVATVGHKLTSVTATPGANDRTGSEARSVVSQATPASEQEEAADGDGDPPPSRAARRFHTLRCKKTPERAAERGKPAAAEDAPEDHSSQSLQLLQVLRRSAQLLREATHTLYFVNCSSLMPSSRPCARACCRVSGVCIKECFALDPTAFAAFVGRLCTLAVVQQCSFCPRSSVSRSSCRGRPHNNFTNNSRGHCTTCVSRSSNCSRSNNCGGINQDHGCGSALEAVPRERQQISFICCRLQAPHTNLFSVSELHAVDPDAGAPTPAGAAVAAAAAKQVLERCCSCCMRENFNTAMQLLRTPYTKQQLRRAQSPGPPQDFCRENTRPKRNQHRRLHADVLAAEEGSATTAGDAGAAATAGSASHAPDAQAASAAQVSTTTATVEFPHVLKLPKTTREPTAAQSVLQRAHRACAAAPGRERGIRSAGKEDASTHFVATAADDESEGREFGLFVQHLQEAAAAAAAASARTGDKEIEEELASAAAEETALRGSPRFLFVHALLHFMWAWQGAAKSDAGAAARTRTAGVAAVVGLPSAGPLASNVAGGAESAPVGWAATEAGAAFFNEDGRIAAAADPDVSGQLTPKRNAPACTSAARSEAADEHEVGGETAGVVGVAVGEPSTYGASAAAEKQVDVGDRPERMRHVRKQRKQALRRRPAFTSAEAELHLRGYKGKKEPAKRLPSKVRQLLARTPSQIQLICSALRLHGVHPVQLFHVGDQPQQQGEPQAPVQRVPEQQQRLESVEEGQLLLLPQQQQQGGVRPEQRSQERSNQQQQDPRLPHHNKQREMPVFKDKQQQQQERERGQADEPEEEQEEFRLLQPPFRVGAVVNLFGTLLRLGCVPQRKGLVSCQSLPIEAHAEASVPASASASVLAGVRAIPSATRQREKGSDRVCVLFEKQEKMTADRESPFQLATIAAATDDDEKAREEKGKNRVVKRTTVEAATKGEAMVVPTGELGRQLLLIFLQLVRRQRQFARVSTGSAQHDGEAEAPASVMGTAAFRRVGGAPTVRGTAVVNIWFSSLDAVLLLNDEDENSCSSDDISAVKRAIAHGSRRGSCVFGAAAAPATPLATSLSPAASSTATRFSAAAAAGAARFAQAPTARAGYAAAPFSGARDVFSGAVSGAQELCASFEGLHKQVGRTATAEEEASILPASTFLQLLPTLLAGLVEVSAASPYDASAAPFPPVLLELRWVQESSLPPATAVPPAPPLPTAAASSPERLNSTSFAVVAPREATGTLPAPADCRVLSFKAGPVQEPERCCTPSAILPAPAATPAEGSAPKADVAVAAATAANIKGEPQPPETMAYKLVKSISYGHAATTLSGVLTAASERGFDGTTDGAPSSGTQHIVARQARLPHITSTTAAEYSATSHTGTAPAAVTAPPSKSQSVSRRSAPAVAEQCIKLLLAPAGLLQQHQCIHHSRSGTARASPSEQHADGSEAAAGEREERAAAAERASAPSAARRNRGSPAAWATDIAGEAAVAKGRSARESPAVRMALQEQLFNFVYCTLQEAVRAGPLPVGFWRRENGMLWERCSCGSNDADSICCIRNNNRRPGSSPTGDMRKRNSLSSNTSLRKNNTSDGTTSSSSCDSAISGQTSSRRSIKMDAAGETHWLDCVEQCVLEALYTQVQLLCTGLHRYSNYVSEEICSRSCADEAAARSVATAEGSRRVPEKTPVGNAAVAFLQPPQLQQVDLQLEQHEEKKELDGRQQQDWGRSRTVDEDADRSGAGTRDRKNLPLDWKQTFKLAAPDRVTQGASAAAEIAAAAHVLLHLAADLALLARIKSSTSQGNSSSCRFDSCSGRGKGMLERRQANAEETPSAVSWARTAPKTRAKQTASETKTATVAARAQAPANVKPRSSELTWKQAATAVGVGAIDAHHAATREAESKSITAGTQRLAAVDTTNRSKLMSHWRGSSSVTYMKQETRADGGSATGSLRWWVEDETCNHDNARWRKIVVEVIVGSYLSVLGDCSFRSSATVASTFRVCDLSASVDVCTPQKQVEVLASLAQTLRCSCSLQRQQEQRRRSEEHMHYLPDLRKAVARGRGTCGEEEKGVTAHETQDPSEGFYLHGGNVGPASEASAAAARTKEALCWLKVLCQLEEDENIRLSLV